MDELWSLIEDCCESDMTHARNLSMYRAFLTPARSLGHWNQRTARSTASVNIYHQ